MTKTKSSTTEYPSENKMITVTDGNEAWHPCYPNNQIEVGIAALYACEEFYVKVTAWGADDFGVEIYYKAYGEAQMLYIYDHYKKYIYDKIENGVNLEWFYKHGFVPF